MRTNVKQACLSTTFDVTDENKSVLNAHELMNIYM